jgi:AcrR family transcriptional regulator
MTNTPPARSRSQRTREKLVNAFVELVLTRGYERVCPADVAARAGVGRSTFYNHFSGVLALLETTLERPSRRLASAVRVRSAASDLVPLLQHFREQSAGRNPTFFCEPIRSLWSSCLARAIAQSLRRDPDRARHRPAIPRDMLSSVLAELQIAIICRWVAAPEATSVETIAASLTASARALVTAD